MNSNINEFMEWIQTLIDYNTILIQTSWILCKFKSWIILSIKSYLWNFYTNTEKSADCFIFFYLDIYIQIFIQKIRNKYN